MQENLLAAPQRYRRSGKVSPASLAIAALVLVPLGLILGVLYSAAVVYLPFIKLRGLITFFMGAGIGAIAGNLCYRLKYRNGLLAFLTIMGFTAIAYYASWAVHPALVFGVGQLGDAFLPVAIQGFDPRIIIGWMNAVFTDGIWAMGGGGNALSGWGAVVVWIIEAGLIFGAAGVAGMGAYGNRPFCENCYQWNDETEELAVLPVSTHDPAWNSIRSGHFDALTKLQISDHQEDGYVELRLAECPTCDENDYLSAIGIELTVENGEVKKKETDIFRHLSITHAQRDEVVAFAEAMAAAVEEMKEAEAEELAAAHQEDQAPDSDAPFRDGELSDNDNPGDFPPSETRP